MYLSKRLDFEWQDKEQHLEMRDGRRVSVKVGGYWKEPVASYYQQKCQAGLYQALHRIRPYLVEPDDERYVFIFTNMPIPCVKVDHLLGETAVKLQKVVDALRERLDATGGCSVSELKALIASWGVKPLAAARWVQRYTTQLATASDAVFEAGKGSKPGRFVRQRPYNI